MKRGIVERGKLGSCFFRSSVEPPYRKVLLQIIERCNLHCAHCFVSAGDYGDTMSIDTIREIVIPKLKECRVVSITLTGGEPFLHAEILEIVRLLREAKFEIGICTNGTVIRQEQMEELKKIGDIHINVSLDGFRPESHGKFRGEENCFAKTIDTIYQLSSRKLLKGLLVTPNSLAEIDEYEKICEFAIKNGATYVLMNPLSYMGRGTNSIKKLRVPDDLMREIKKTTFLLSDQIQLVYIRFPNDQRLPLVSCEAGNIIYAFVRGEIAVCPYLVFSARTPRSLYKPKEFIVGNLFEDSNIADKLDEYKFHERYCVGDNQTCRSCFLNSQCGKGCPAAIIASGQRIEGLDSLCPILSSPVENK